MLSAGTPNDKFQPAGLNSCMITPKQTNVNGAQFCPAVSTVPVGITQWKSTESIIHKNAYLPFDYRPEPELKYPYN